MNLDADFYQESTLFDGCKYGNYERANKIHFYYHSFSLIMALSVASMLLFNSSLKRFYAPLAKISNAAICFQVLSDLLYFYHYPYGENEGNCGEALADRLYVGTIMFGELHQIYLLANMLNMGTVKLSIFGFTPTFDRVLNWLFLSIVASFIFSTVVFHMFTVVRNLWCVIVCVIQLYIISLWNKDKATREDRTDALQYIATTVRVYEKLSILQFLPAMLCFAERSLYIYGIDLIPHFGAVTLILDVMCNFLFYLKVLLIKESSDVKVEVIDA